MAATSSSARGVPIWAASLRRRLVVAFRRFQALPACAGCCDPGRRGRAPRLWRCRRLRRRARPRRSPPWLRPEAGRGKSIARSDRARRARCGRDELCDAVSSTRNGSSGWKNRRARLPVRGDGRLGSRAERRNSCSTSSAPGASSPRSKPRSSSAISRARASGFRSRRYCRNRSTSSPSAIPLPTHFHTRKQCDSARALRTR